MVFIYKSDVNNLIFDYYKEHGRNQTIMFSHKLIELKQHKDDKVFRAEVHGEVCESILEICIIDFMTRYPNETKDWFYDKGMILTDPDNPGRYLTEIDITLFTPYKLFTIECKSYSGDKTIKDKCTIARKGIKSFDVYGQHEKHYHTLIKNMEPFRILSEETLKIAPLQIGYFDFSLGSIVDKRDTKWKRLMPVLNVNNIDKALSSYFNRPTCWKMDYLRRAVAIIDKNKSANTKKHLAYVKHIHQPRSR